MIFDDLWAETSTWNKFVLHHSKNYNQHRLFIKPSDGCPCRNSHSTQHILRLPSKSLLFQKTTVMPRMIVKIHQLFGILVIWLNLSMKNLIIILLMTVSFYFFQLPLLHLSAVFKKITKKNKLLKLVPLLSQNLIGILLLLKGACCWRHKDELAVCNCKNYILKKILNKNEKQNQIWHKKLLCQRSRDNIGEPV